MKEWAVGDAPLTRRVSIANERSPAGDKRRDAKKQLSEIQHLFCECWQMPARLADVLRQGM